MIEAERVVYITCDSRLFWALAEKVGTKFERDTSQSSGYESRLFGLLPIVLVLCAQFNEQTAVMRMTTNIACAVLPRVQKNIQRQ